MLLSKAKFSGERNHEGTFLTLKHNQKNISLKYQFKDKVDFLQSQLPPQLNPKAACSSVPLPSESQELKEMILKKQLASSASAALYGITPVGVTINCLFLSPSTMLILLCPFQTRKPLSRRVKGHIQNNLKASKDPDPRVCSV